MTEKIQASCHCGAIVLSATLKAPVSSASRCTCTFCRRRQAANVSVPAHSVVIEQGADMLRKYSFGTHTAQHYFCGTCGIYTHHKRRSDPTECGVNVGCIKDTDVWKMEPLPWHDGVDHPSDL